MKTIFFRVTRILVWVALALYGLGLVDFLLYPLAKDFIFHSIFYRVVSIWVLTPITLLVGLLIMRRAPGNIVGPLLIVWSGTITFSSLRQEIGPLPYGLFSFYDNVFAWFALCFMLLHFPDGRIYPQKAAPWLYSQFFICMIVNSILILGTASINDMQMPNPFFISALEKFVQPLFPLAILFVITILLTIPVSLALRYRKSGYLEKQQIKWLALFGAAFAAATMLNSIVYPLVTGGIVFNRDNNLYTLVYSGFTALFPPVAIGVAVLRHHLWDIDLIIRRTLVYSILTVSLTLVYFVSVVSLQALFQLITKQETPPVATVISTLTIAVLFTPFRQRIQAFIDRRFFRKKYNADQVLEKFNTTLREVVDLDHMLNSILGVVEDTIQPAHGSLWLRKTTLEPRERK